MALLMDTLNEAILETAYLVIKDCREGSPQTVTPSDTKSVLGMFTSALKNALPTKNVQDSKTLKVQFNPTTLSFQSSISKKNDEKASINKMDNGDVDTTQGIENENQLSVSMNLVFDRTIYADCSVQSEVEGFMALIKNPYIRQVNFCWGKLYYEGVVQRVEADYVLFNALGIPTRANVKLVLDLL